MEIISPANLESAITHLKNGGVIVYPTETSYGIGCDATNAEAVARIFAIKGRPAGKGVTLLLPSNNPFGEGLVKWDQKLREIAEQYWPAPLNIVVEVNNESPIPPQCLTGSTVAVRRSSHPIAQALVDALGVPLVSTSANLSGEKELYSAKELVDLFRSRDLQPDAMVDAGTLERNPPSTLIALDRNKQIIVLRQGAVTLVPSK